MCFGDQSERNGDKDEVKKKMKNRSQTALIPPPSRAVPLPLPELVHSFHQPQPQPPLQVLENSETAISPLLHSTEQRIIVTCSETEQAASTLYVDCRRQYNQYFISRHHYHKR